LRRCANSGAAKLHFTQRREENRKALKSQLSRYKLAQANEALAAVAEGRVLKALIDPR